MSGRKITKFPHCEIISTYLPEIDLKTQENENDKRNSEREQRSPNAQGNIYINFGHGGAGSSNFGSNHGSNFGSNGGFGNYGGGSGSSSTFNSGSYDYFG